MPDHEPAPPDGRLERALQVFTRATSRIHAPVFWRALYATLFSTTAARALGLVLRVIAGVRGDTAAEDFRERMAKELVRSGWPHHSAYWRNLHASRFLWRAYQSSKRCGRRTAPPAPAPGAVVRLGVVGTLSRAGAFPPELFAAAPPELDLVFFDIPRGAAWSATYLSGVRGEYSHHVLSRESWWTDISAIARSIDVAHLDVLLVLDEKRYVYDLLDRVSCPCVVDVALGAAILAHDNVAFHVHSEREADYFVTADRMFCGTTRRNLSGDLVFPGRVCYDRRGIDPATRRRRSEREPLMVFHGALYKANSPPYLDVLFGLMHEDPSLDFVLMGHDWDGERPGGALAPILERARRAGLEGRVHYEGEFLAVRDETSGEIRDDGWSRLLEHLDRARLAPNPWPVGGAASRVEAYLSGVPVPHLGVRTDPASWGRPQHGGGEIPALVVESTTAWTPEAYAALARRMLYDDAFAERVVADQLEVAERVTDRAAYWQLILDCYRRWSALPR